MRMQLRRVPCLSGHPLSGRSDVCRNKIFCTGMIPNGAAAAGITFFLQRLKDSQLDRFSLTMLGSAFDVLYEGWFRGEPNRGKTVNGKNL